MLPTLRDYLTNHVPYMSFTIEGRWNTHRKTISQRQSYFVLNIFGHDMNSDLASSDFIGEHIRIVVYRMYWPTYC